jgi:hypothetical protein
VRHASGLGDAVGECGLVAGIIVADQDVAPSTEERLRILICFIGYALWKTLQQWQARAGLGHSPRTILTELSRIHAADVVLPLADTSSRELRIRCVVRPEREQQILLQHLGLELPQRLKPPATPQM